MSRSEQKVVQYLNEAHATETGLVRFAHGDLLTAEKAGALATALGAPDPFPAGELHLHLHAAPAHEYPHLPAGQRGRR